MYIYPVKYVKITQYHHQKYAIDFGYNKNYYGKNQAIYAVNDGYVLKIERQNKGGNVLYLKHNDGYISEYAHLMDNSIKYNVGDYVKQNDIIANMGNTGVVTGYHLHFSLYNGSIKEKNKLKPLLHMLLTDEVIVDKSTTKKYELYKYLEKRYVFDVDDEGLNVRNLPSGKLINERLLTGSMVKIHDIKNDWLKIGDNKWVYRIYLSKEKPQHYVVTGAPSGLNVRNKASLKSKIINVIENNTPVTVYKVENGFAKVSGVKKRYVYNKYLKKVI